MPLHKTKFAWAKFIEQLSLSPANRGFNLKSNFKLKLQTGPVCRDSASSIRLSRALSHAHYSLSSNFPENFVNIFRHLIGNQTLLIRFCRCLVAVREPSKASNYRQSIGWQMDGSLRALLVQWQQCFY